MNNKPRVLIWDIETSPMLGYVWSRWQEGVTDLKDDWHMLTFSAKWLGEKKVHTFGLDDFKGYKKDSTDDRALVMKLWEFLNEADVAVAHYGNAFDVKKFNARCIQLGIEPPAPYKKIDTKAVASKYFKFNSNKLDHLGELLGLGRKVSTGGFKLWLDCMAGDKKAWKLMKKYNEQDVNLLEKVYLKLRPWMEQHPNQNLITGDLTACPKCGSKHIQRRGFGLNSATRYQRWHCQDCSAWSRSTLTSNLVR